MKFKNSNQISIFDEFTNLYGKTVDTLYPEMQAITVNVCTNDIISTVSSGDSPFFYDKDSNGYKIEYAPKCCDDYEFTDDEKFALIAHELGHIILDLKNQSNCDSQAEELQAEELQADKIASTIINKDYLKSALQKMANSIDMNNDWSELQGVSSPKQIKENLEERIKSL